MRTLSALKLFLITVFMLILAACGGGGSGGSDDQSADSTKKSELVSVSIADGAAPVSLLETPAFKDIEYSGDPIEIPKNSGEADQLLTAFDESGRVVFMTLLKPDASSVKVDAETTVIFFLSQVPGLRNALDLDNALTVTKIFDLEEVGTLVEFISSTPGWGELTDDSFTLVLAEAISAILASDISTLASSGTTWDRTKTVLLPRIQDSDVVNPTYIVVDGEEDVAIPPSTKRQFSKDGLLVSPQALTNSTFDLKISNTDSRTVVAIVAEQDPALINSEFNPLIVYPSSLVVGGGNSFFPESDVLKNLSLEITNEQISTSRLYTYGPGTQNIPTTGLAQSAFTYSLFTSIVDLQIAPMLSLLGFDSSCARAIYSSSEYNYYLASVPLQDALTAGIKPTRIALLIYELYKSSDAPSASTECAYSFAKDSAKKKMGVIGAIWTAIDVASDLLNIVKFWPETFMSDASHTWNLVNRLDTEIDLLPQVFSNVTSDYLPNAILQDRSEGVTPPWTENYQGECIATDETSEDAYKIGVNLCSALYFESTPGGNQRVTIAINCKKPAGTNSSIESTPCKEARFKLEAGATEEVHPPTSDGSSVIKFSVDFEDFKEYKSELLVIDNEGAEKLYILHTQIFGLYPQVVPFADGAALDYEYLESESRIETANPIELVCCEDGKDSVTKTITLKNQYRGVAVIDDYQWIESSPNISVNFGPPSKFVSAVGGETNEQSFDVTYTPSSGGFVGETATLRLNSNLFPAGEGSISMPDGDHQNYDAIDIKFESDELLDCSVLKEQLLGKWTVSRLGMTYGLALAADGIGRYIGDPANDFGNCPGPGRQPIDEDGNCNYPMSWDVTEYNGRCYFNDDGFWVGGRSSLIFDPTIDGATISDPINYFEYDGPYDDDRITYTR